MHFSVNEIIKKFWRDYHFAVDKADYYNLLVQAKLNCLELMENLEGEEFLTFYDNSPLFAMISEVHRVCPNAVEELAAQDKFFETALNLFIDYSDEKRELLRDTFLIQPNTLYRFK
ncbi:hypothetical protein WMO40_20625 [Bacillaceae bacterium CLA-AA-H227]|uniref:Uncharacterized protein n=1 Tax=Robertmurraya yapensis (ex Hitch et al 2024) TaxID=3133160 RepID=A0ACC6SGC8_9BACI